MLEILGKDIRGKVWYPDMRQDQKTTVIGNKRQPLVLKKGRPSNPLVTHLALERCCRPSEQGKPLLLIYGYVSDAFTDEGMKSQVMVLTDEFISLMPFAPVDGSYLNIAEMFSLCRAFSCPFMVHEIIMQEPF